MKAHYCLHIAGAAAAKSLQSCLTLCNPIDGSPPGSPSLGFSRPEHWSGLPFPSPNKLESMKSSILRMWAYMGEQEGRITKVHGATFEGSEYTYYLD